MTRDYNFSLIFYPQREGGYTVICPEIPGCVTEGETIDEAAANIRGVIADFLPEETKSDVNEETLRLGLCIKGKLYQEYSALKNEIREVESIRKAAEQIARQIDPPRRTRAREMER